MIFRRHLELAGKHALLSPSQPAWLNYDDQKLEARFHSVVASRRGTDLHDLAHKAIVLGVKLSRANKALATYVNDAIQYKMVCEQMLVYSDNCFGTADTLSFNPRSNKLRIHDLKTGIIHANQKQLEIYAALFCLEYAVDPTTIDIELRIYQRDDVRVIHADQDMIAGIMEKIVDFDNRIEQIKGDTW